MVYEQVLEDRNFSIEHVFVYNAGSFKMRKLFAKRGANQECLFDWTLVSQHFYAELWPIMLSHSWLEVESIEDLPACLDTLRDRDLIGYIRRVNFYVVWGSLLWGWGPESFEFLRECKQIKHLSITLRSVTVQEQAHVDSALKEVDKNMRMQYVNELWDADEDEDGSMFPRPEDYDMD